MSDSSNSSSGWALWSTIKATSAQLESTAKSYLSEAPDNEQIKERLAAWGSAAGRYLDAADERIGELESSANKYLRTLVAGDAPAGPSAAAPAGPPAGPPAAALAPSRLEQELKALHTNPELWVGELSEEAPKLGAAELEQYPELEALYAQIVPSKLTSNQFWNKYEELRAPILKQDERRKQILSQSHQTQDEEGWGSSDEE